MQGRKDHQKTKLWEKISRVKEKLGWKSLCSSWKGTQQVWSRKLCNLSSPIALETYKRKSFN